jgi:hypothetical protein
VILDAGPLITDGERVNSRLWALVKRASQRGEELHTTHPVMAQVWRTPSRQANLARLLRHMELHPLDNGAAVGQRLASSATADVVDTHLAVLAEQLGTFIVTSDPADMTALSARFEAY